MTYADGVQGFNDRNQAIVAVVRGWAELDEVMATLSELAETCLDVALSWLHEQAVARFGNRNGCLTQMNNISLTQNFITE